jgi:hypothetical protein
VPYTIRDPRTYGHTVSRWKNKQLSGKRTYVGTVAGDSIVLQLPRGKRLFRRVK